VLPPLDFSLYLVTDTGLAAELGVVATVVRAVAGGVTAVQLRDPDCSDGEFVALGRELRRELAGSGVPLLVNDRVHLAEAIGADGVHVGQGDLDVVSARQLIGPERYLGLSVETLEQLTAAIGSPVDYLGVGPVWPQSTKLDAAPPVGLAGLTAIVASSRWPCVAIGGIGPGRARLVREAGAAGIAVVSAIVGQPDPEAAARGLRVEWDAALS
jgi:thiamine-phosphate pyrophosphorylase